MTNLAGTGKKQRSQSFPHLRSDWSKNPAK
jgi:hypothetical protein